MDDAIYFHERLSGFLVQEVTFLHGFPSYIWTLFYSPFLIFAFLYLARHLWKGTHQKIKKRIIVMAVMFSMAIFLDFLDGLVQKSDIFIFCRDSLCDERGIHLMRLFEEVFEVIALGLLGYFLFEKYLFEKKNDKKR